MPRQDRQPESLPDATAVQTNAMVYIVDDDLSIRRSLLRQLSASGYQAEAFASAIDFLEARSRRLAIVKHPRPTTECLVLDICMPAMNGLSLQEELARRNDLLPIIFITGQGDVPSCLQAMKKGAVDYLSKPFKRNDLESALQSALSRCQTLRHQQDQHLDALRKLEALSARERDVLECMAAGRMNKQIAADLDICESTVKVHRGRIMEKLEADSMVDITRLFDCATKGTERSAGASA